MNGLCQSNSLLIVISIHLKFPNISLIIQVTYKIIPVYLLTGPRAVPREKGGTAETKYAHFSVEPQVEPSLDLQVALYICACENRHAFFPNLVLIGLNQSLENYKTKTLRPCWRMNPLNTISANEIILLKHFQHGCHDVECKICVL